MMIRLSKAEIAVWTMVEAQGYSRGTPIRGFPDDNVVQPSLADWRLNCQAEHVSLKICDAYYVNVKASIGEDLLRRKTELHRQIDRYKEMLKNPGNCDESAPLDRWFSDPDHFYSDEQSRAKGAADIDRMPGDVDPKGRSY